MDEPVLQLIDEVGALLVAVKARLHVGRSAPAKVSPGVVEQLAQARGELAAWRVWFQS
jgi:hypothetical protein